MFQGIAYAVVAGLPPQFGLYASIMGAFGYTLFGSTKVLYINECSGSVRILAWIRIL
jgi:MFS superfamily sulfate permease-like transporter